MVKHHQLHLQIAEAVVRVRVQVVVLFLAVVALLVDMLEN
jgi:hypothetical protein